MTNASARMPATAEIRVANGIKRLSLLVVGVLASQGLSAGDWKLSDSISADLTYVDRSGRNKNSGTVLQLSPRLSLRGKGGRSEADINYGVTASIGGGTTDPKDLSHNLRGRGSVEIIENKFTLGANASARLVGNSSTSGTVDAINAKTDGRQSYSFQITPEFRHHLNKYADIVSRNTVDYVGYSGEGNDGSREYRANIGIRSGRYFGPLSWSVNIDQTKTSFEDSARSDDESETVRVGVGYRLSRKWQLRADVGYEDNDVETARDDTDGSTWNVGVDWTPNPRTSVSANYGSRYLGNTFSGSIKHRSRRTTLSANLSRDISNRRTSQLSFFRALIFDQRINDFIRDPATGQALEFIIPELNQIDENFVNTQLRLGMTVSGRRTSVSLSGDLSNRDYEVSDLDEDSYGLTLSVSRSLGSGYSGTFSSKITNVDRSGGGGNDTYDVSLSLSKKFSPRTRGSIDLLHREENGSGNSDDYTENRIGISLTSSFL